MALGSEGWLHNYLPPPASASANGATSESKLAMEGVGSGYGGTARPQSSTSLSPPSHLAMPQVFNLYACMLVTIQLTNYACMLIIIIIMYADHNDDLHIWQCHKFTNYARMLIIIMIFI